jgi:transmembrane sensor
MEHKNQDQRYIELSEKWLDGTITPEEEKEYADWYKTIEANFILEIPADIARNREQHRQKILDQIRQKIVPVIPMYIRFLKPLAVATVLLFITLAAYFHFNSPINSHQPVSVLPAEKKMTNDINSGSYGAILTSSSGKMIILDTAKNNDLIKDFGKKVVKTDSGIQFSDVLAQRNAVEYYTLSTPRARQQKLSLPDGTIVWLNAQSSLKFPSAFTAAKREVVITGEAYFEVAKDAAHPFIVHVNEAAIEVLGTHFNVMAYPNESTLETTLLEGSVKFIAGNNSVQLKPGQQSEVASGTAIKINNHVDVDQIVAWKNGIQSFNNADIKAIMRQVERWYDVDVEYKGTISLRQFSGDIPRGAKLSELLKLFDVNKIHFSIDAQQKKLTVLP